MTDLRSAPDPETRAGGSLIALLLREVDERYVMFGDEGDAVEPRPEDQR